MDKNALLEWDSKHNAMKRTKEYYWHTYKKWRDENKDDYHRMFSGKLYDDFISVQERAMYLKYSFNTVEATIYCSVHIFYVEEPIGTYDVEFFLNGEVADDYLDFERDIITGQIARVKHSLKIARNALKLGLDVSDVAKIVGIPLRYIKMLKEKHS